MVKIALCLHGLSMGYNDKGQKVVGIKNALESILKNVVNNTEYDIFFHTWINDNQEQCNKLLDIYKPKKYIFENPLNLENNKSKYYNALKSKYLSIKKVINLAEIYSNDNNIEYDMVFTVRFDCIFLKDLKINELNIKDSVYISSWEKYYDKSYFEKFGCMDFWWFSSLNNVN